ncbi:MAG: hypothetical protein ACREVH_05245 [Gammaproteobacteria bacterium]
MFEDDPIGLPRRALFSRIKMGFEEVAFLGIVVLSVIGESVGQYSPIISFWYWLTMIPVFAATAIITEWSRARAAGQSAMKVIWIQVAHWGGTVIALFATYSLWHVGRLGNEHTGLIVLMLLALTTFLDGYHVGWRFYLAGALLFIYAIVAALLKAVLWITLLIAIPVVIFGLYWDKHHPLPTRAGTTGS